MIEQAQEILHRVINNVQQVILGKQDRIEQVVCCWMAGGHVLLEDVPGVGKTILARTLAKSAHVDFKRVQFTPDLLPSDITGTSIYNQKQQVFEFNPGPIFTSILLADEINRATPRTQSALLEAMSERQVSTEGTTRRLDDLFFTIATQNPVDQLGTFVLPEAQLDRFMMKISMGYPGYEHEFNVIRSQNEQHPIQGLQAVESHERLQWVSQQVARVALRDEVLRYLMDIVEGTRNHGEINLGASPRASLAWSRACQSMALIRGEDFVRPQVVYELAVPVLAHRLVLTAEAKLAGKSGAEVLQEIMESIKVPTGFE